MTPFMINICRCYKTKKIDKKEKKNICDDIIKTASPYTNPELKTKLDHVIFQVGLNRTLKLQQKDLENISLR